ncbi:discoidin domain-containing protein [Echinicola salinicaeni]|uniref:discoidin domain-containing protein n=1 Tax=Echinicola salinicaeni TaxID=2762757 RepID=UPI001648DC5E|nr:discoidin domain-containing protein [Echinicola salinicaeni]
MLRVKKVVAITLVGILGIQSCKSVKNEDQDHINIYISPDGNDSADGTSLKTALKSLAGARDLIREKGLNQNMREDLYVFIEGGRYELNETVVFGPEDGGSNGYDIIYKNLSEDKPRFSAGKQVKNWNPVPGKPYFEASVKENGGFAPYFKQLYVDGLRAQISMSNKPFRAADAPKEGDVLSSEMRKKTKEHPTRFWWDDPNTEEKYDGILFSKGDMGHSYSNIKDLSLHALLVFKMMQIPVEEIIETEDAYIFRLPHPGFAWWTTWQDASGAMDHFIVNAIEELDEPGEWCLNTTEDKIYYYPLPWQNMEEVEAYVPVLEGMISLKGTPESRLKNIQFDGLVFEHGNWFYPEKHMLGRSQAEITGEYDNEVPGQVVLNYTDDVQIKNSIFRHHGSSGIQPYEGTNRTRIEGNKFYDLSAAGVSIGKWYLDKMKCDPSSVCKDTYVLNNVIRNIGRDYYQASAINTFAAYNVHIENNDISDIAYAGIHARIGDKPTHNPAIGRLTYRRNKVSRSSSLHKWGIRDGGTLYTHGYYPNCLVEENFVPYTSHNVMDVFYADNWSNDSRWQNNVSMNSHAEHVCRAWMSSSDRVIFDTNYGDAPCPSAGWAQLINYVYVENGEWPEAAQKIMQNAGVLSDYQDLASESYGHFSLLEGKPVSSSSEEKENEAAKGNDNDWETYWHTAGNSSGKAWYQVDMEGEYVIEKVSIIPVKERFEESSRSNYEIQASNDPDFNDYKVLAFKNEVVSYYKTDTKCSNMWEVFLNNKKAYRYLRLVANNEKGSFSFSELEAFGYPMVQD